MTTQRAYFHARSAAYILWLFVEPFTQRLLDEARHVAESRRR